MGLLPRQDSNLEPADPESDAIPLGHEAIVLRSYITPIAAEMFPLRVFNTVSVSFLVIPKEDFERSEKPTEESP